jgi:hypothetical protein
LLILKFPLGSVVFASQTETGTSAAVVDDWGLKKPTPAKKTPTKKA